MEYCQKHITESMKEIPEQYIKCNLICIINKKQIEYFKFFWAHIYVCKHTEKSLEGTLQTTNRLSFGNAKIIKMWEQEYSKHPQCVDFNLDVNHTILKNNNNNCKFLLKMRTRSLQRISFPSDTKFSLFLPSPS